MLYIIEVEKPPEPRNNFKCPRCDSKAFKRNGTTRHGKQNHRCLDCHRQFSQDPRKIKV